MTIEKVWNFLVVFGIPAIIAVVAGHLLGSTAVLVVTAAVVIMFTSLLFSLRRGHGHALQGIMLVWAIVFLIVMWLTVVYVHGTPSWSWSTLKEFF